MNTLLKFIMIPAILFGALDWAAENPAKVKAIRNKVVKKFDEGTKLAGQQLDEVLQ